MHSAAKTNDSLVNMNIELLKGANVVDNQAGFFVTQRLRDRIGKQEDSARYRLEITPNYRRRRFGLTDGDVASRYDITVSARWNLFDAKTGRRLSRGNTSTINTFGAPSGPFGVITADNIGVEQSAKETADKIIIEIARYFAKKNKK